MDSGARARPLDGSGLDARLGRCREVRAAAEVLVDHLARVGPYMPSLYLARGGRLRFQALRGYWQVLDGFPPDVGVIGRTWRTGVPTVLTGVASSDGYLQAVPGVQDEVCVPICLAGEPVGVLNVEGTARLPIDTPALLTACAALFATHLERLGGLPEESPAQRLLRHTTRLAGLRDHHAVVAEALSAAVDVSGMGSAVLALVGGAGPVRQAIGPLATALLAMGDEAYATIVSVVEPGTSCYTLGEVDGEGFGGHGFLRAAGAGAVVVVPLAAGGDFRGMLLVADRPSRAPSSEVLERLELLATQTATTLQVVAALAELEDRAERDALTGLGHSRAFRSALRRARAGAGAGPGRVALLLVDVDDFKLVNDRDGHLAGDRRLQDLAAALSSALRDGDALFRIGGDEFAVVATVVDEEEAAALGRRINGTVRRRRLGTVSVGMALAGDAEGDDEVFDRADAALYRVKADGRDGLSAELSAVATG